MLKINQRAHRATSKAIRLYRASIDAAVSDAFDHVIQAGSMKGVRLPSRSGWGAGDVTKKTFGLYEAHLHPIFAAQSGGVLIDIGAADGYWGVGLVAAGIYERSICFEARRKRRAVLKDVARINGVSDRIDVRGAADEAAADILAPLIEARTDLTFLIDIEGGEYDLITPEFISRFPTACFVIELHPHIATAGHDPDQELIDRFEQDFQVALLGGEQVDISPLSDIMTLHDDLKWVLASEGRPVPMRWLVATPKL